MINCPVCNNSSWKKRFRIEKWDIDECPECTFAKINPMPVLDHSRKDFYNEDMVTERVFRKKRPFVREILAQIKRKAKDVFHRDKSLMFYRKLLHYLKPNARVLDIACGDGAFLRTARNSFECTGNEISEFLGQKAAESGLDVVVGDFMEAPFNGKRFDGITMISLLEHLPDPEKALSKCYDLLDEDGVLILKTVNYKCWNQYFMKEQWTGFRPPDHMVYFTPENLKQLLKKIGFKKVRTSGFVFNDNMYCDAQR